MIARKALNIGKKNSYIQIQTDGPEVRICALTDSIIRVRASFNKDFAEHSYILMMTAWDDDLDAFFGTMRTRVTPVSLQLTNQDNFAECLTKNLTLRIYRNPYHIEIYNENTCIYADLPGRTYKRDPQGRVYHYLQIDDAADYFYGFGETSGPLNKRGRIIRQAPRDAIAYDAELTTPLYKHIPFFIRLNAHTRIATGIFYHTTFESVCDVGCERSGYYPRYAYFCADGGDIDMFFIYGPTMREVIERYTDITGKSAFPPIGALGYLGSSMYYTELEDRSDECILEFVGTCHEYGIPISNFHLSSGYSADQTGKRCVFTWNAKRFPNPEAFFDAMHKRGVTVTPNVKPGMLLENPHYKHFDAQKAFVQTAEGNSSYIDRWWGGDGSFVDFTSPAARRLWKDLLIKEIIAKGTVSVWNDNCEYDSIDDRRACCNNDGKGGTIDELKPVQSLLMAHVACEAIAEAKPLMRPFVVNRSGCAGFQRYASTWSGDNYTSWKTLKFNIATMLGMGLSGVAINGCDTGGFAGPSPEEELFVRWVQNSIFHPRFSIHSCNDNNTVTEPWMYKKALPFIRDALHLRYSLIPYMYSLCYEAHTIGSPITRPLVYEFQDDTSCYEIFTEFLLGPFLLVATVIEKGVNVWQVYLPKGSSWYCWHTRNRYEGGSTITIPVTLASIPLFIRSGAIIPQAVNFTDVNRQKIEKLHIIIAPEAKVSFTLFEDDGISFAYKTGIYLSTKITVMPGARTIIYFEKEGNFPTKVKEIVCEVISPSRSPVNVFLNEQKLAHFLNRKKWEHAESGWYYSHTQKSVLVKYPNPVALYSVTIDFGHFDLLKM